MPYRDNIYVSPIEQEMAIGIKMLKRWHRYDPVIAGNSLWCWAAGQKCHDIDIFMESTWWRRRRLSKIYGNYVEDSNLSIQYSSGYGDITGYENSMRFLTMEENIQVDILAPWKSDSIASEFDYKHLASFFGLGKSAIAGADLYGKGQLVQNPNRSWIRDDETMKGKLTQLWGDPYAESRMEQVMYRLNQLARNK